MCSFSITPTSFLIPFAVCNSCTSNKKPICSGHKGESLTPSGCTLSLTCTQGQYHGRKGKVTRTVWEDLKRMNVEMMFLQLVKQSPWWSADNCSTCVFLVCKVLLKTKLNKIPIKLFQRRVWYSLAIEQYQTQLFWEFGARTKSK